VRKAIHLALFALLASCGGSDSDYALPYVGTWTGAVTATSLGQASTGTAVVPIHEVSANLIELLGFCADADATSPGPMGSVTSNGFTLTPSSCSWTSAACTASDFTLAVSSGDGSLNDGVLNFAFNGSGTCGSKTVPLSVGFKSSAKSGDDSARNGDGLAATAHISW
jgi:hypothetical protein